MRPSMHLGAEGGESVGESGRPRTREGRRMRRRRLWGSERGGVTGKTPGDASLSYSTDR